MVHVCPCVGKVLCVGVGKDYYLGKSISVGERLCVGIVRVCVGLRMGKGLCVRKGACIYFVAHSHLAGLLVPGSVVMTLVDLQFWQVLLPIFYI